MQTVYVGIMRSLLPQQPNLTACKPLISLGQNVYTRNFPNWMLVCLAVPNNSYNLALDSPQLLPST
ncbi:MAG TPA: hypothetical protein V6D09_07050 [Leptolyngbyaceae cyanobacterium]